MRLQVSLLLVACSLACVLAENADSAAYPEKCFFSTQQTADGTWWLVDPAGKPFISKGVNAVTYMADRDRVTGNNTYNDNIKAKFPTKELWAAETIRRFKSWGFNSVGGWSSSDMTAAMPYALVLYMAEYGGADASAGVADYFSPTFINAAYAHARSRCAPLRNDTNLIGYWANNELRWAPNGKYKSQVLIYFLRLYSGAPGRVKAESFLAQRYGNIDTLQARWGVAPGTFKTWFDIKSIDASNAEQMAAADDWTGVAAEQYSAVTRAAILAADPNHLLLGVRIAGYAPAPAMRVFGQYNDIFSLNSYGLFTNQAHMNYVYGLTGLPFMLTEFSFKIASPLGGMSVATQAARAASLTTNIKSIIAHKGTVGYHWFQYVDQPEGGRSDGEAQKIGLVNLTDVPYREVVAAFTSVNSQVERLHTPAGQSVPTSFTPKCINRVRTCPSNCNDKGCCIMGVCQCFRGALGVDCSINTAKWAHSFASPLNSAEYTVLTGYQLGALTAVNSRLTQPAGSLRMSIGEWQFSGILGVTRVGTGRWTVRAKVGYAAGAYLDFICRGATNRVAHLRVQGGAKTSKLVGHFDSGSGAVAVSKVALSFDASADYHSYEMFLDTANHSISYYVDRVIVATLYNANVTSDLRWSLGVSFLGAKSDNVLGDLSQSATADAFVQSVGYEALAQPSGTCPASPTAAVPNFPVYENELSSSFVDWSWGAGVDNYKDLASATTVYSNSYSIRFIPGNWNALYFSSAAAPFIKTSHYGALSFWINGGAQSSSVMIRLHAANYQVTGAYAHVVTVVNAWKKVTISTDTAFKVPNNIVLSGFQIQSATADTRKPLFIDDVYFVGRKKIIAPLGSTGNGTDVDVDEDGLVPDQSSAIDSEGLDPSPDASAEAAADAAAASASSAALCAQPAATALLLIACLAFF